MSRSRSGTTIIKLEFEKDAQNLDYMTFERTGGIPTWPFFGTGGGSTVTPTSTSTGNATVTPTATGNVTVTPTPGTGGGNVTPTPTRRFRRRRAHRKATQFATDWPFPE